MLSNSVCIHDGEKLFLHEALADFSTYGARYAYAEWLEKKGDAGRATAVRATIKAFQNLDANVLKNLSGEQDWLSMIAVPLLRSFIVNTVEFSVDEVYALRDKIFSKLRPCLSLSYTKMLVAPKIGESYLWGNPDLLEGAAWPRVSEVSNWFDSKDELPHSTHCAFLGQIAFTDLQDFILSCELPLNGGVSIFAISEVEELGIVETLIRPWSPSEKLVRRNPPQDLIDDELGDGANNPHPPYSLVFKERLSLPDVFSGVFSSEIPECKYGEKYSNLYEKMFETLGLDKLGIGGYLQGTSGDDPSPDTNSLRFMVLRVSPEFGVVHFAIPREDMEIGRLDRVSYVWNDWDS